jgi:hypothetical protein
MNGAGREDPQSIGDKQSIVDATVDIAIDPAYVVEAWTR